MNTKIAFILLLTLAVSILSFGQTTKSKSSYQNSFVKLSDENPFYSGLTNGDTYFKSVLIDGNLYKK